MALAAKKINAGFADVLKGAKTDKPKSKSSAKEVPVTDEIRETIIRYVKAKEAEKIAKAEMDSAGDVIIDYVRKFQDEDGFKDQFTHTYKADDVKYVSSNRFIVSMDDLPEIEQLFGDACNELFSQRYSVSLKDEIFEDEEKQAKLMDILGEKFNDFFNTTSTIKVCEEFDRKIYKYLKPSDLPAFRTFVRQYKPSIR